MSERLSNDHLLGVYDAGYQGFSKIKAETAPLSFLNDIDFEGLVSQPDAQERIHALPTQVLYHSLVKRGLNDCVEILPLISAEQFVRIFDYDIWHEDRLVASSAFKWLKLYHEAAPEQMVQRFRQLDEEYQIALLSPFCRVFSQEEVDTMSEEQQDMLYRFPSDSLFYSVNSADPLLHGGITQLIDTAMGEDMAYAMSLLTHASFSAPNEQEHLMLQFRTARLEEDGFVSYEESQQFFLPNKLKQTDSDRLAKTLHEKGLPAAQNQEQQSFLGKTMSYGERHLWSSEEHSHIQLGLLHLANATCVAAKVEPEDHVGLRDVLEYTSGLVGFGLELLCNGEPRAAAQHLKSDYPKKLFTIALGFVDELRLGVIACLKTTPFGQQEASSLKKYHEQRKYAQIQKLIDTYYSNFLDAEQVQVIKGLFNRFPLSPKKIKLSEGDTVERIRFCALSSVTEFTELLNACGELAERVQLASWACQEPASKLSIDQHLLRALVSARTGEPFHSREATPIELQAFLYGQETSLTPISEILRHVHEAQKGSQSLLHDNNGFVRKHLVANLDREKLLTRELNNLNERLNHVRHQGAEALSSLLAIAQNEILSGKDDLAAETKLRTNP